MQKLSTLLALTALTCQPKNQCRVTVSVSLRQTPFSFLHTLYFVIDSADTDIYVAATAISQKLPCLLCIKRKQTTILCRNLVPEEMADCIVLSCQKRNGPKMAPHSTSSRKKWNGVPVLAAKNSTLLPKMELLANRQKRTPHGKRCQFGCQYTLTSQ